MKATGSRTALLAGILAVFSLVACSSGAADRAALPGASEAAAPRSGGSNAGVSKPGMSQPQAAPAGSFTGNVVETMDAGSYTYVLLEGDGEQVWAAGPRDEVAVGDEISISMELRMENFESSTLNRVFEEIYFVGPFRNSSAADPEAAGDPYHGGDYAAGDPHAAGAPHAGGNPHAGIEPHRPGVDFAEIDAQEIAKPEGGLRVEEIWNGRQKLAGAEVVLRGRVVKFNGGIMGRNWLHVQDGSGDPEAGTHDLTVTSADVAREGDLVTVKGTVVVDQDFGAGYTYDVLVEQASVTVTESPAERI